MLRVQLQIKVTAEKVSTIHVTINDVLVECPLENIENQIMGLESIENQIMGHSVTFCLPPK